MSESVSSCRRVPGSLREAVLTGPGVPVAACVEPAWNPLVVVASPQAVRAALTAAGYADKCRGILTDRVSVGAAVVRIRLAARW
jgi:hypothetical protein